MNANELADELQAVLFACGKERPFLEHATMLRKLQTENEALKECIRQYEIEFNLRKAQEK